MKYSAFKIEKTPIQTDYDFVIIGAGPAGSFAGRNLIKKGFKVLILDSQKEFKRKVCGEYLCPRGVELLQKNDLSSITDQYSKLYGMKIVTPQYKVLKADFPSSNCTVNYGISVNRQSFDKELLDDAISSGADYCSQFRVVEITEERNILTVRSSEDKIVTTKVLIGADGRHSFVSKHLNAHKKEKDGKLSIHAILKLKIKQERYGQMHLLGDGMYIGINPINDFEVNVSIVCRKNQYSAKEKPLDFLLRIMRDKSILYTMAQNIETVIDVHTVFPIKHHVSNYKPKNIVLIGDAAGFIDPLTGEGMYNALLGAKNLANVFHTQEDLKGIAAIQEKLNKFYILNKRSLLQKNYLNLLFQKIINNRTMISYLFNYLSIDQKRADSFIGVIGNTYNPLQGIRKIVFRDLITERKRSFLK